MSDSAPTPRRRREATRQLWIDRLARFPTAGLSLAAFCAAEGVSVTNFYHWKRQLAAPAIVSDAEPCFLPVRLTPSAPVELLLPGGAILRLAPGCDLAFVRSLLEALAVTPC